MIIDDRNRSLEEQVYYKLEEDILCGAYQKGDVITESAVARKLGVSRTPARSAMHKLAEDGLIELVPNKGALVIGITAEDLVDTYRIRMRLEGLASFMATGRLTDEDVKVLTDSIDLADFYIKRGDIEKIKELNNDFHVTICRASGNRLLTRILTELHRNIRAYRKLSLSVPGRIEKSILEHREILKAMIDGDSERADRLTSLHIERAMKNMISAVAEDEADGGTEE